MKYIHKISPLNFRDDTPVSSQCQEVNRKQFICYLKGNCFHFQVSLRNIQIFGEISYFSKMLMLCNNPNQLWLAFNIMLVFYVYFTQTITGVSAVMICQLILSCIQFHFLYHRNLMLFFIASWCQIVLFSVACWYHLEKSLSIFSRCYFLAFIHVMLFSKDVSSTTSSRFLMIIIKIIINLFVNNIY